MQNDKNRLGQQQIKGQIQNIKEYWTQHRTTLIAFQAQYIYNKKKNPQDENHDQKNKKNKKKDIQYDGGFLFPGRQNDKQIDVVQKIKQSKFQNLKQMFDDNLKHTDDNLQLRQFIKIMLELKHSCIFYQFLQIYQFIIEKIKDIKFQNIKQEKTRQLEVKNIGQSVVSLIQSRSHLFPILKEYIKQDKIQTIKLFKITAYCFLAQKHNFNINQYYCQAFEFHQTDKKIPKKKKKTEKQDQDS